VRIGPQKTGPNLGGEDKFIAFRGGIHGGPTRHAEVDPPQKVDIDEI